MAELNAKKRDGLPTKSFGLPSKRAYHIETVGHAKSALATTRASGTPAEVKKVKEAVAKKYPSMDVKGVKKKGKKSK